MKKKHHDDESPEDIERETEAAEPGATDAKLADIEKELLELKDRYARALAEMDNTRKRAQRDVEEGRRYAVSGLAKDLLEVVDNLQRALAGVVHMPMHTDYRREFIATTLVKRAEPWSLPVVLACRHEDEFKPAQFKEAMSTQGQIETGPA